VVRALRGAGYDVTAVAESAARSDDPTVLDLALRESRVLLTEDKDFGQMVYAAAREAGGVVLIRFPPKARTALPAAVVKLVETAGEQLRGSFAVLQPGRTRIGRLPGLYAAGVGHRQSRARTRMVEKDRRSLEEARYR
jgi:predicted nuclease of predicted toxin-antitoxin system